MNPFFYVFLLTGVLCGLYSQSLEIPAPRQDDRIIRHEYYTLSYNEEFEQADWVAYELTRREVLGSVKRDDRFRPDPLVASGSASLEDYKGSGYDRGHLAPAGDMKFSESAMSESFYLSNMSPQDPSFNRGIWKGLEALIRQWAYTYQTIFIATGPVLNKQDYPRIGPNRVAVPGFYYKVILRVGEEAPLAIGFILPNSKSSFPLASYTVTVDDVEILTGIDFFPTLPDEQEELAESVFHKEQWDFSPVRIPPDSPSITPSWDLGAEEIPTAAPHALYWINSSNGTRHNPGCRYYGNTSKGYYTEEKTGIACGLCGG